MVGSKFIHFIRTDSNAFSFFSIFNYSFRLELSSVFVAVRRLSLVAAKGGCSLVAVHELLPAVASAAEHSL